MARRQRRPLRDRPASRSAPIYAWNGSDPRALIDFRQRYPGSRVVRLRRELPLDRCRCWRSESSSEGERPWAPAQRPAKDRTSQVRSSTSRCSQGTRDQAVRTADRSLTRPMPTRRSGVVGSGGGPAALARRGQAWPSGSYEQPARPLERELQAAGIPFRSGGGRAFLARPTVRRALDRLTSPSGAPPAFEPGSKSLPGGTRPSCPRSRTKNTIVSIPSPPLATSRRSHRST